MSNSALDSNAVTSQ